MNPPSLFACDRTRESGFLLFIRVFLVGANASAPHNKAGKQGAESFDAQGVIASERQSRKGVEHIRF